MQFFLLFAALTSFCVAPLAIASPTVTLQAAVEVETWSKGAKANANEVLNVVIALKNREVERLSSEVLEVSSPHSPRYGQHLQPAEISALTGPQQASQHLIRQWLTTTGVETATLSKWGDRFHFRANVSQVEALFSTKVHWYNNVAGNAILQAMDLHAPVSVATEVAAVFGLHGVPIDRPKAPRQSSTAAAKITPELLAKHYGVAGVEVSRGAKNRRATVEFQGQYTKQTDLSAWFAQYVPNAKQGDEIFTCFPGDCEPPTHRGSGLEAMLDVEYIMGPAPGIKTEVWSFQNTAWCTDLKDWTSRLLDHEDPPLVFSISYGIQGNVSLDKRMGCSEAISRNIEEDFAKIAARGISLIFSSGDSGSGGNLLFKHPLWPVWPGSAPHVTAVGATQFETFSQSAERAVTSYGSGGGFSWRFPQQPWQREAVEAYKQNPGAGLPRSQDFNAQGRATPDVSALGLGYQVMANGHTVAVGGTSASAPFFASLISLLNEHRLQNGKSPLGFLNPLLYEMAKNGTGFTDVTVGDNHKDRTGIPVREGYSCTKGWDAVTGWGTPVFGEMLQYVKGLPSGRREHKSSEESEQDNLVLV